MISYHAHICDYCNTPFEVTAKQEFGSKDAKLRFCTRTCHRAHITKSKLRKIVTCSVCQKAIERKQNDIKKSKSGKYFCSRSCSAKYNNTHKSHGTRRSKLETYIEEQLKIKYPFLQIDFNKKDAINSELDIYIPSLKLAFELNGIYHYEPIHGTQKLASVQNNDDRKFQACLEHSIELCIIDTSSFKHFKENKAKSFLDIICNIIQTKQGV